MRRHLAPVLIALASAAAVALLAFGLLRSGGANGGSVGATPPQNAMPVLGAKTTRGLVTFRGRPVVVNVFASWCPPCKEEAPVLRRAAARGTTVVGISYNDAAPDTQEFMRRFRLDYPVLRDVDQSFSDALGVKGVPETFVLDARGKIVAVSHGAIDDAFLRRALGKA